MDIHKKYSLVQEHDKHFEIHDSSDNKRFSIPKKQIHPATQMRIMKMQKFSDGGEAEEGETVPSEADIEAQVAADDASSQTAPVPEMSQPMPGMTGLENLAGSAPGPQASPGWQAPMLPQGQAPQEMAGNAEGPQAGAPQAPAPQGYTMPGMDMMAKGMQAQAGAQMQAGRAQEAALKASQAQEEIRQKAYETSLAQVNKEQDALRDDLRNQKIDPRRYFNNMDTSSRIGTAIAMVLGGIGAGLTHGPNLAIQMIDKAVDNDIAAQKADLGNKQTLFSMNMQKYHNLQTAEAATRLHYNTVLQNQLQVAQAKASNGIAAGALQMKLGELQHQDAVYKNQIALQQTKAQQLGANGGEGGLPVSHEPGMLLLDPKYTEKRVEVNGRAYQATDKESAGKVRDVETLAGPVIDGVKRLKELADDPSTRFAGTPANAEAKSIMGGLSTRMPLMAGATIGAKRVNAEEIQAQHERFQDPTRFDQTLSGIKSDRFLNELEKEVEGMRSNHLVGYKGAPSVKSLKPASGKLPLN